ncbi:MAG: DNA-3-methyladenine glycosylase family protein, partial [Oscillospiraceae bacterium]
HYGCYPTAEQMSSETTESLSYLRSGFRAKYIIDAVEKINSKTLNLEEIRSMPIDEARTALKTIKGVGPKVAECVLLFGMYRIEAFPVDVWVKRVMQRWYPNGLPQCVKGYEGIAQQYLFHYIRNTNQDV